MKQIFSSQGLTVSQGALHVEKMMKYQFIFEENKWRILLRPKGIACVSVWPQIWAGFGGAWSYRPSLQFHFPGEWDALASTLSFVQRCNKRRDSHSLVPQIQNLGYFPVRDLQLNIEIPEMSKNGKPLLQISDFYIDKVSLGSPECWIYDDAACKH